MARNSRSLGLTLHDRIWFDHVIDERPDGTCLLYVDRHLVHEVDSPQAFEALRSARRKVRAPDKTLLVVDHNVPTSAEGRVDPNSDSALQMAQFAANARDFGLAYFNEFDKRQGICHVVGPEQGFTLPGTMIVCGDSHTPTHGAFGALAYGIGTSELEHVLATQTLLQCKPKNMRVRFDGSLPTQLSAKDVILAFIGEVGAGGATGYAVEFVGETIEAMSIEERMTICNMSVEAGARTAIIAPDEKTCAYLQDKPRSPKGEVWTQATIHWESLRSDANAEFERKVALDVADLAPMVTWGTNPEQVIAITGRIPSPSQITHVGRRQAAERALAYMGLKGGEKITDVAVDRVFIGSCTNARIEDLREAAKIVEGKSVNSNVRAMIVPGSGLVKLQAEAEGLAAIFAASGFDWREPGCSMCLAMNGDNLAPGERCASTSSRNFEGRQGYKGRTHLVSPAMAAAAAIAGRFVDIREWR